MIYVKNPNASCWCSERSPSHRWTQELRFQSYTFVEAREQSWVAPPSPGHMMEALLTHREGCLESISDYQVPVRFIPNQFQFPFQGAENVFRQPFSFFFSLALLFSGIRHLLFIGSLEEPSGFNWAFRLVLSSCITSTSSQFLARWLRLSVLLVSSKIYWSGSAAHVLAACNLS